MNTAIRRNLLAKLAACNQKCREARTEAEWQEWNRRWAGIRAILARK